MWAALVALAERFMVALVKAWLARQDTVAAAQSEQAAEIADHDRKRANEIRNRVDNARLGGGLHPKPDDTRGYRD